MWEGWENFPMIISTFAGIPTAQNSAYIIGFAFSTFSVSLRNNRVYSKIRLSQNLSMALDVQMNDHELFSSYHFWRSIWFVLHNDSNHSRPVLNLHGLLSRQCLDDMKLRNELEWSLKSKVRSELCNFWFLDKSNTRKNGNCRVWCELDCSNNFKIFAF